ncbi:hypothetical protein FHS31_001436 [Sphingomonas vulcanisoli]|uniref:Uncharacterized protein n=1 Tax=Sphingomonas vulcanisoli TaxID=1658060 RepID=A0ABX0TW50_9SPHN|nr:hypothetical protein [Sphingomonas vulcanisoli]NIJ07826.1 hypothetical protein [Sphingomonas vulcanisoli]
MSEALKAWAKVLGFLLAFLLILGSVAYFTGRLAGPRADRHGTKFVTPPSAEARH